MQIKMVGSLTGMRNGAPAPKRGDVLDVPEDEGAALIAQGMAEATPVAPAAPTETADAAPEGEQATAAPAKPARRPRKATA